MFLEGCHFHSCQLFLVTSSSKEGGGVEQKKRATEEQLDTMRKTCERSL